MEMNTTSWHSYPKVYALGHAAISELFEDEVIVEEKVDGSQFSFGKFDGKFLIRSKNKQMDIDAPEKMFVLGAQSVQDLDLKDGWTYRAEYLMRPKHNVLAYDRMPTNYLMAIVIGEAIFPLRIHGTHSSPILSHSASLAS